MASHFALDVDPLETSTPSSPQTATTHRRATKKSTIDNNSQVASEPWFCGAPYEYEVPKPDKGEPWENCYKRLKDYDDDACEVWRDGVDQLLIFAGLFSSAVTAFVIESYKKLQEDPSDRNSLLLQQILLQAHIANSPNPSAAAPLPPLPVFVPSASDVRVNVFWFMSLALSLATVFIGILCLQWLREYQREIPLDPREAISLRQLRYEGLMAWKVPGILMSLPILLQGSFLLFFMGLLDLLWSLDSVVAICVTIITTLLFLFTVATTLLPTCQIYFMDDDYLRGPQCAFKSPQSWAVHRIITALVRLSKPKRNIFRRSFRAGRYTPFFDNKTWVDHDKQLHKRRALGLPNARYPDSDTVRGLAWIDVHLGRSFDMVLAVYHCIRDLPMTSNSASSAARVIAKTSENVEEYLKTQKMVDRMRSASEEEYRDIVSALFLEENRRAFPQLDQYQLESVVRILNTRSRNSDSHDDTPFRFWPLHHIRNLPTDLVTQFLLCVKSLVSLNRINKDHINDIWDLIHLILSTPQFGDEITHSELAFDIMVEFEKQLPYTGVSGGIDVRESVRQYAIRMIKAFPVRDLKGLTPRGKEVLSAINVRMLEFGGPKAMLSQGEMKRWDAISRRAGLKQDFKRVIEDEKFFENPDSRADSEQTVVPVWLGSEKT
ncbi:hypothetical protein B0H34DRAFT_154850 [Crassisporium funariophilum]|nr:hypothetical protein B0H34DRAFT_154850 [Crassisporium funariophilum]